MKKLYILLFMLVLPIILYDHSVLAQNLNVLAESEKCDGPVYSVSQLTHHAELFSKPSPELTDEARAKGVRGRVVLSAVLCKSGKVTDMQIIEGLPAGMTEQAIAATKKIEFRAAEKDGEKVSQRIRVEYNFHFLGDRRPSAKGLLEGRNIESIEISAPRTFNISDLISNMKTKSGEPYNKKQIEEDYRRLLSMGNFDKQASRLVEEEGVMGGVGIYVELKEAKQE